MYKPTGVVEAVNILSRSTKFLVYYDPDIDGVTAGAKITRLLRHFNQPFEVYINDNRQHGFKMTEEQIQRLSGYTLILVDAAMSKQEVEMLVHRGVNVINIDHHELKYDDLVYVTNETLGTAGVIINNQYPFEPDNYRFLSGAGVVYYFIHMIAPELCDTDAQALVGLSLLSDIRPLHQKEAQAFLHVTYTADTPLINYLIQVTKNERDYGFGRIVFDRNFIDFTFSPKINAMFRLNMGYDVIDIFNGTYEIKGDLEKYRKVQKSICETMHNYLLGNELSHAVIKSIRSDTPTGFMYDITNFIGLVCSQVTRKAQRTAFLYVHEEGKILRGSVRGYCEDVNYLKIFRQHGFQAEGHKNAFGVLHVDMQSLDMEALNQAIEQAEAGYEQRRYDGRLIDVVNFNFFLNDKGAKIAKFNTYVRNEQRIYIQYKGSNVERTKKGKATKYLIDGIPVLCFDEDVTVENGLIVPMLERGYATFYLEKR